MASKITKRLREKVDELNEYVTRNEGNIKRLKEEYEITVNINKHFTDRIKAMKKEIYHSERRDMTEAHPSLLDEEFA